MKVVWDFVATGAVKYWTLADRPNIPKESMNATGDKLITDGKNGRNCSWHPSLHQVIPPPGVRMKLCGW